MKDSKSFEKFFNEKRKAAKAECVTVFAEMPDQAERKRWAGCMKKTMMAYIDGALAARAIDNDAAIWYKMQVYGLSDYIEEQI